MWRGSIKLAWTWNMKKPNGNEAVICAQSEKQSVQTLEDVTFG